MRLIRATTALKRYFDPVDGPDIRSLIAAVQRGDVPGQIWGKGKRIQCWVDAEYFEGGRRSTGNALADKVLVELGA